MYNPRAIHSMRSGSKDMTEPSMNEEPLLPKDDEGAGSNVMKGYLLTLLIVVINTACLVITQFVSSSLTIPQYSQNFVMCATGSLVLGLFSAISGQSLSISGGRRSFIDAVNFGIATWFFQWGYTKCLISLSPLQYTAADVGVGPVVSVTLGFALCGEGVGLYKFGVMVRNVIVVALIANQSIFAGDENKLLLGNFWACVAFCGTSGMRIVQRTSSKLTPVQLAFWGYAMGMLLWMPPGAYPRVRIPFLWPTVPQDDNNIFEVPLWSWLALVVSGLFGTSVLVVQGMALKYLDVGMYSIVVAPMVLLSNTVYDMSKHPAGLATFCGIALTALGFAADVYRDKQLRKGSAVEPHMEKKRALSDPEQCPDAPQRLLGA
jgi:hypothetical protein